ncbi:glycoside hydrolase family 2 protein [Prolixibacter denitrificans]|uniref:Glycosyl hydrolase family 2 n=1 Tax=Prolixibacter denitrificans TaxID=1541063 RepID=A0A2P8CHJ0_9BACT|nr:sugar-binding domain-containing protein [Prolixibacter denitrificans]PSK84406.1 glycosyl hydrolase family 2 [Prolixibacter denitrificans]GET20580.1 hypothetical protein JCM18694_08260 [Prolixibacter denitrificans]
MKLIFSLFFLCSFFYAAVAAPDASKNIPLKEHPRPGFQRNTFQNLNGTWHFRTDKNNAGVRQHWQNQPESFNQQILVPFSWASPKSGIKEPDVHYGWYTREFTLNDELTASEGKTYLVFMASDFHTTVWLNGHKVGEHRGGYTLFDFDIQPYLQQGKNRLVVRVEDRDWDNRPSGKQYYGNARGIWQTVYLEKRPDIFIKQVHFLPDIDKKQVTIQVTLSRKAESDWPFTLTGENNNLHLKGAIPASNTTAQFTLPVKNMLLWELSNPFLYNVTVTAGKGKQADEIHTYFGMRKISSVKIPREDFWYVALNNKPIYLRLTLDQSYHPEGFYTFPSDNFMKNEIKRAKALGLNGLRIHIKAEIPRKLYWADKLGLLIMEDIPNFWGPPTPEAKKNWEELAVAEINRDFNHPSIFSWVLFNETWGLFSGKGNNRKYTPATQQWVADWYHKAKKMDPTRLVEDNSPCNYDHVVTDLNSWHAYLPARQWSDFLDNVVAKTFPGSTFNYINGHKQGKVPMLNSECGAVWGYAGSTGDIDLTWEYHVMMNEFRRRPKIAGFLFTEFHDVINEWNGYYRFDRSKKIFGLSDLVPGMSMRDFHSSDYVIPGKDFYQVYQAGQKATIPVAVSSVTQKNIGPATIAWYITGYSPTGKVIQGENGTMPAVIKPFEAVPQENITTNLPENLASGMLVTLLKDENGNIIQRNFLPFRTTGTKLPVNTVAISPSQFSKADWTIKYRKPQEGKKVWGMGTGYFEYRFKVPTGLNPENVTGAVFRCEVASRFPQSKYLEDGDAENIGMTIVTEKGTDPGYGQNSYPQTDENKHPGLLSISIDGKPLNQILLEDDPADHRGMLSWMNQKAGDKWGENTGKKWMLDEAGSYGYLVTVGLSLDEVKEAMKNGFLTIRLTSEKGGLSVYGAESGRYPVEPQIEFLTKE